MLFVVAGFLLYVVTMFSLLLLFALCCSLGVSTAALAEETVKENCLRQGLPVSFLDFSFRFCVLYVCGVYY